MEYRCVIRVGVKLSLRPASVCVFDRLMTEDRVNSMLLFLASARAPPVPPLFAAAALLPALLATAQPQRAPPYEGRAPHPTDRHDQGVQHQ